MKKEKLISKVNPLFNKGIAHRGLHTEEFTENGMKAFKNAIDNNVAFELDIHLTKDNELVVCHDESLKRTTGKDGIIEELTLEEIKSNYTLLDGGEIPTLKEVLELNNEQVPMVIELKVYKNNYKPLARKLIEELKNIKDKSNYFLISFYPQALYFAKKTKIVRGLLVTPEHEWTFMLRNFFESVDIDKKMIPLKKVQKYAKKHYLNVWTIETEEDAKMVAPYVDTITFQHIEPSKISSLLK